MKKLEYMEFHTRDMTEGMKHLNQLGAQGWELVNFNVIATEHDGIVYFMVKREINNTLLGE